MKTVYRVEGAVIREWAAPADEVVVRPFTEVPPPAGDDIIVKGFDWNNSEYIVEKVVPVALYEAQQAGFEELAMMVGQIAEKVYAEDIPPESEYPEVPEKLPEQIDPEPTDPEVIDPEVPGVEGNPDEPTDPEIPVDSVDPGEVSESEVSDNG